MKSEKLSRCAAVLIGLTSLCPSPKLFAETGPGQSESVFTIGDDGIDCTVTFAWQDLDELVPLDENGNGTLEKRELRFWRRDLSALTEVFFEIYRGDEPLDADSVVMSRPEGALHTLVFQMRYPAPEIADWDHVDVAFESLEDFPEGHRHQLSVQTDDGQILHRELFGDQLLTVSKIPLTNPLDSQGPRERPAVTETGMISNGAGPASVGLIGLLALLMVGFAAFLYALFRKRVSTAPQDRC